MLQEVAPQVIVPELRPYRSRGEISTWARDPTLIAFLEDMLGKRRYVALGEFHIYGADADLPNVRKVVELARNTVCSSIRTRCRCRRPAFPAGRQRARAVGPFRLRAAREGARDAAPLPDPVVRSRLLTAHAANGKVAPGWREAFLESPTGSCWAPTLLRRNAGTM